MRTVPGWLFLLIFGVSGCDGRLMMPPQHTAPLTGPVIDGGALPPADSGTSTADSGVVDAGHLDAGHPGSDAGVDPCAGLHCGVDAHCVPGAPSSCACNTGFTMNGADCVPTDPGDPAAHSQQQVCDAWAAGHVELDHHPFSKTTATCDPGQLSDAGIDDALTRLDMHRWLVGLAPVSHRNSDDAADQDCAMISAWNPVGSNAHFPPPSSTCYTADGAAAAGSSNIAWGCGSPSDAIDIWMQDNGNATTFGHRRWLLNPPLDPVGLGYYEGGNNYGSAACIRVFNGSGSGRHPTFYAYPPPGFAPNAIAQYEWTVHGSALRTEAFAATVTRMSDGMSLPMVVHVLDSGYAETAIWLERSGWQVQSGQTYAVHLTATGMTAIDYSVTVVECP